MFPPILPRTLGFLLYLSPGGGTVSSDSDAVDSSTLGVGGFLVLAPIVPSPLRAGFVFWDRRGGLGDPCAFSSSDLEYDSVGWFSGDFARRSPWRLLEAEVRDLLK